MRIYQIAYQWNIQQIPYEETYKIIRRDVGREWYSVFHMSKAWYHSSKALGSISNDRLLRMNNVTYDSNSLTTPIRLDAKEPYRHKCPHDNRKVTASHAPGEARRDGESNT